MKYYHRKKSRLSKLEEKRNLQQALFFGICSIVLIIFLIFVGIPLLFKMVIFFGDWRSHSQQIEKPVDLSLHPPTLSPLLEATNSAYLALKGYSTPNTTVKIFLNSQSVKETNVNSQGEFTASNLLLKEGENKIKARTINKEGNESDYTSELIIVLDQEKPSLEITSPADNSKFYGQDREIKVTGITETNATILVNDRLGITDKNGNFSCSVELKDGENLLKIKARDLAGNETTQELKVSYTP